MLLDLEEFVPPVDAVALFGRPCPLEVDLGCGNSRFLIEYGTMSPHLGLLGVERARVYAQRGAARAERLGVRNVRVTITTAEDLLFRWLAPGTVHGVHMYFPDPWPKRRHHKRRMLQPAVADRIAQVLEPGGLLRVKTDHEENAEWIAEVLTGVGGLEPADVEESFSGLPVTNFEVRYGSVFGVTRFARRRKES